MRSSLPPPIKYTERPSASQKRQGQRHFVAGASPKPLYPNPKGVGFTGFPYKAAPTVEANGSTATEHGQAVQGATADSADATEVADVV